MTKITESEIEQFAIEFLTRLRNTLLPKLISGDMRMQLAQGEAAT